MTTLPRRCVYSFLSLLILVFIASCGGFDSNEFGGPYPIQESLIGPKVKAFGSYFATEMFFSKTGKLTLGVLKDGVVNNRDAMPFGQEYQRYNFVIALNGDILIAVWEENADKKFDETWITTYCEGGSNF
ncbi:MAG: hypothetical protein HYU29_00850 [Chloroflexi bacterium]|nr:hypothetical protein [Chloroflexota bacterium]